MKTSDDLFVKKVLAYQSNAINKKYTLTKFLNESEITILERIIKAPLKVSLFGGYEDAELKRAFIHDFEPDDVKESMFQIKALKLKFNKKFLDLAHRSVLGTMMSLGIARETLGDIVVNEEAFIFATSEISEYLIQNLTMINNVSVELVEVDIRNYKGLLKKNYEMSQIILSSMRIDVLVARVMALSREKAHDYIVYQNVKVNHKICENPSQICKINDIISIRKLGRVKIFDVVGSTKKEKIVLSIGILR